MWGQGSKAEGGWGGSLAGMQSGGWFDLPVSFPIPSLFPDPLVGCVWMACGGGWWWKTEDWWQRAHLSDLQSF